MAIPKIIHFVWIGPEMPDWAKENIEAFRCLNPEYEIMIHGEKSLDEELRLRYDRCKAIVTKADLIRLCALKSHGGWYFDTDFYPIRSIDKISESYGFVNDSKMFISEQHWIKNTHLIHTNAILAASAAPSPVWDAIMHEINKTDDSKIAKLLYGPQLLTGLVATRPELFQIAGWPGFYSVPAYLARSVASKMKSGVMKAHNLTGLTPELHGLIPSGLHLFADGKTDIHQDGEFSGMHAAVITKNIPIGTSVTRNVMASIAQGLEELGISCEKESTWEALRRQPNIVFVWNGRKSESLSITQTAKQSGCIVFRSEHGFFNRNIYTQLDHEGILHWASWSKDLCKPAPVEGAKRLKEVWEFPFEPFKPRNSKRILVLGQLNGDSQMMESEIQASKQIAQLVKDNLPLGYKAFFRPHPKANPHHTNKAMRYLPLEESDTLLGAVLKSKFAVTINSNAGNECLGLGCPVLAFGPALYLQARVGLSCNPRNIKKRLQEMADGWMPDSDDVKNYLNHLACRQWSFDELKQGKFLKPLIEAAQCPSILL